MNRSDRYRERRCRISAESVRLRGEIGYSDLVLQDGGACGDRFQRSAATFRLLHESDDARFCLFETEDAHLNAVNAAHLA